MTGVSTDLSREFPLVFGDFVAVNVPDELQVWKFDTRNQLGIYVGEDSDTKGGHLIYWPYSQAVTTRDNCTKLDITDAQFLHYFSKLINAKTKTLPYSVVDRAVGDLKEAIDFREDIKPITAEELTEQDWKDIRLGLVQQLYDDETDFNFQSIIPSAPNADPIARPIPKPNFSAASPSRNIRSGEVKSSVGSKRPRTPSPPVVRPPPKYAPVESMGNIFEDDSIIDLFMLAHAESSNLLCHRLTVAKALQSAQREEWITAIRSEVQLLFDRGTLERVPAHLVPKEGRKIIHSTMQLKIKMLQTGLIDKIKARLCACGNELWSATAETYSPTIGALAYATVHQLAVIDSMEMCTVDTVGAYLYQEYADSLPPIYLVLPANVAQICNLDPTDHYRIRRYLYGLPDSGRAYYKAYSTHLALHGYQRTTADPCLFVKISGGKRTYVFTHVDDTFVCSTDKSELIAFQDMLRLKYEITVNDDVTEYLGIKMTNQPNGDILLTQPKLLGNLLLEYKEELEAIKHTLSPQHLPAMQNFDESPIEQIVYLSLLGALIYLTKSRPDIATAISFASVYSAKPTAGAYTELLFCLKYLSDTQHLGLLLKRGVPGQELTLTCYVDASYLTHSDSKSHTGFCLSFGTIGTFYSKSSKQTLVATSSTHAEMRALFTCVIDIIFVLHLCDELQRPVHKPAIIMEDNQPVIDLTEDFSARSKRCKHFLMLVHYIKEQVSSGLIIIKKVPTHENIADILTKIVVGDEFRRKALSLLGHATL
jgi:histone deacetylase 1/2